MDHSVYMLKNKPSLEELALLLTQINQIRIPNRVDHLNLITTLLHFTIPETYLALPNEVKKLLISIFQSTAGLGNLVSSISLLSSSITKNQQEYELLVTLVQFMIELFQPGLVQKLVSSSTQIESKEIDKILFKGKCFSLTSEINHKFGLSLHNTIFSSSLTYVGFLNLEILKLYHENTDNKIVNTFIHSLASFNQESLNQYFDIIFNEANWNYFMISFRSMRRFERKLILNKFLCSFINTKYLKGTAPTIDRVVALSVLLKPVFDANLIDEILLEKVISCMNFYLNSLISLMVSELPEISYHRIVVKSLNYWSNVHLMKSESISKQEFRTHLVISLLSHCSPGYLKELLGKSDFLDAISNRLNSFSSQIKALGVILADKLSEFAGIDIIFNLDNITDYKNLIDSNSYFKKADVALSDIHYAWELVDEPEVVVFDDTDTRSNSDIVQITEKLSNTMNEIYNSDDESDIDSDDEDDPTIGTLSKVAKPLYIKDLLTYLTTDSKNPNAYEYRKVALNIGPTLIRQKSSFGNELKFYAEDLLTNIIAMTNTYDEPNFENQKLNCLIAVIASDPGSTLKLCQLFATGDYSLQQRMCLLSTMSLAARELKGFKDELVVQSYNDKQFPSKKLPSHIHEVFRAMEQYDHSSIGSSTNQQLLSDYGLDSIQHSIQDDLMQEASNEAKDKIAGGKILRISRSLLKRKDQSSSLLIPKVSDFGKLIGSQFFFPLITVWYEAGEIKIGHYSTILIAHFIKTLSLIIHAAYPISSSLNEMVKEFLFIVIPIVRKVNTDELQIIESIATGILLICDITDAQFLITNFSPQIRLIQEWLSVIWEGIINDKVKSLCAGLLLRLNEMNENFEKLLLDNMNNLY